VEELSLERTKQYWANAVKTISRCCSSQKCVTSLVALLSPAVSHYNACLFGMYQRARGTFVRDTDASLLSFSVCFSQRIDRGLGCTRGIWWCMSPNLKWTSRP